MSEAIAKTAEGYCEEISERNGWTEFHINVGSKYPLKLATKIEALIKDARAVGNAPSTWKFKESEGNPNPNRPGSFYMNRYLEGVEPSGIFQGVTLPEAIHAPIPMGDRDRTITRMACLKAATVLYQGAPVASEAPVDPALAAIVAAGRFENWVYRDIDDVPFEDHERSPEERTAYEDAVASAKEEGDGIPY
jgi:hypothetical protein